VSSLKYSLISRSDKRKMKSFRRSIKAVSPVIATIIIVAIAITMSIAVAYWLLGLGGSFTKFEKVEFATAYVTGDATNGYNVTLSLKNTGSAPATVDANVTQYNGRPDIYYTTGDVPFDWTWTGAGITMDPGATSTATIQLPAAADFKPTVTAFSSGMTLEITLHTTGGKDYPKALILP
jgi:FlaG/FlaF family flagellin (archaellin)